MLKIVFILALLIGCSSPPASTHNTNKASLISNEFTIASWQLVDFDGEGPLPVVALPLIIMVSSIEGHPEQDVKEKNTTLYEYIFYVLLGGLVVVLGYYGWKKYLKEPSPHKEVRKISTGI